MPLQQSTSSLSYDTTSAGSSAAAAQAAKKRKKDPAVDDRGGLSVDLQSSRPIAGGGYAQPYGQPSSAGYAPPTSAAQAAAARQSWMNQTHQGNVPYLPSGASAGSGSGGAAVTGSSYRGGYPGGNGVVPNGVGSSSRQQIVQHAGDAAKRMVSSARGGEERASPRPISPC